MNKKRSYFSFVSLAIILAFLYQASFFIPVNQLGTSLLLKLKGKGVLIIGLSAILNALSSNSNAAAETPKQKVELTAKRKKNSKTFRNEDGSLTAEISQVPVHYKDREGKLRPIDTSLVKDTDGFRAKENSLSVDFNNQTANLFELSNPEDDASLTYKVKDSNKLQIEPAKKADNKLAYEDYKEDASLSYTVQEGRLKEDIVLSEAPEEATFSFELDLKGLKPKPQDDGSIMLLNKEGKPSIRIERPYMEDANSSDIYAPPETFSSYDIEMKLTPKEAGIYTLTLTPDKNWLESPERAYPVKIDPTFSVPNTSTVDTYIRQTAGGSSYGTEGRVYVGGWSPTDQTKALFKFDLSNIPDNATINSATLNLTKRETLESNINAGNFNQFNTYTRLFRTTADWNDSSTWNSMASNYNPSILGQDSQDSPVFDVTSVVNNWQQGTYPNYGFMLDNTSEVKLIDDSSPGGSTYQTPSPWWYSTYPVHSGNLSHKEPNASGTHQHKYSLSPQIFFIPAYSWIRTWVYPSPNYRTSEIMLQYMVNGGWEHRAYWGANSINWGTNGTASRYYRGGLPAAGTWTGLMVRADYVNLNNQQINGAAFTLYNGQAYFDDVQTWRTQNFYTREASVDTSLKPKLTVSYTQPEVGLESYRSYKEVGNGLQVDLQNGNLIYSFDDVTIPARGVPTSIAHIYNSRRGLNTGFGYNWSLSPVMKITEASSNNVILEEGDASKHLYTSSDGYNFTRPKGKYMNLVKNANGTYTLDDYKEHIIYNFNSSGLLTSAVDANGNTTSYTYSSGLLIRITDASGRQTNLTYTSSKLTRITDAAGRQTNFTYSGNNLASITNAEGEVTSFSYNASGQLTGLTNPMGAQTTVSYNASKQVSNITLPTSPSGTTSFTYTPNGSNTDTNVTDAKGNTTAYRINSTGQTTKITEALGATPDPATPEADFPNDEAVEADAIAAFDSYFDDMVASQQLTQDEQAVSQRDATAGGLDTTFTYDANYNLLTQTDKNGKVSTYTYDSNGNLVTETDNATNQTTTNTYDADNNLLTTTTPDGNTTTSTYDENHNLTSTTDAEGNRTTYGYDGYGNKVWEVSPRGNELGANPANFTTAYAYDTNGNYLVQTTGPEINNPDGTTSQEITSSTYDAVGNKLTDTDGYGNTTYSSYDNMGRLLYTRQPVNVNGSPQVTYTKTENTYDANGNVIKVEVIDEAPEPDVVKSRNESVFNNAGQLLAEKVWNDVGDSQSIATTSYTYDANGNKLTETNPLGGTTTYEYDALNRAIKEIQPDGTFTAFKYDALGNQIKEGSNTGTTVTLYGEGGSEVAFADETGNTNKEIYDAEGNQTKTADTTDTTTKFSYDSNGNIEIVTEPNSTETAYDYDASDSEISVTYNNQNPAASTQTNNQYNEADQLKTEIDQLSEDSNTNYDEAMNENTYQQANSADSNINYTALSSPKEVLAEGNTSNSSDLTIKYDASGNQIYTEAVDKATSQIEAKTTATYDDASRLKTLTDLLGITMSFDYDVAGNVTKVQDSEIGAAGAINYTYDTSSRLTDIDYKTNHFDIGYDSGGRNNSVQTLNNLLTTDITYDAASKLEGYINKYDGNTLSTYTYTYDSRGNITGVNEGDGTLAYRYDELNRLTNVVNKDASQVSYTYDNLGNRLTKTDSSGTTSYIYNDGNPSDPENPVNKANSLTKEIRPSGEIIDYTYDENGNTTIKNSNTEGITIYSYDNKNQLVKVLKPNGDIIEFVYNAEGQRIEKRVIAGGSEAISTFYQYDTGGNIVLETDPQKNIKAKYIRDNTGKALALELPTPDSGLRTYFYLYNAHGDVTGLTDESGNEVATYTYDEFGNLTNETGDIYNPIRYSGANNAYYDSETGLYKMGVRYYDSSTGRWLTRDSFKGSQESPQTQNKYIYVENNPLNKTDRTGFWGDDIHYSMTYQRAYTYFGNNNARIIAQGSKDMDNRHNWAGSSKTNLTYHFDGLRYAPNSLKKRFNRARKTAIYFIKKRNKKKGLWWFGMGLHSLQDSFSHPRGEMGVVMHGFEAGIGMFGRSKVGWLSPIAKWYSKYGSIYDSPKRNKNNFIKALQATNSALYKFWRDI